MACTAWHDRIEEAGSIEETVEAVRQYVGAIAPDARGGLPRSVRLEGIRRDDDIDALTSRLAEMGRVQRDDAPLQEAFELFLHASLRISHFRRAFVQQAFRPGMRLYGRQMA